MQGRRFVIKRKVRSIREGDAVSTGGNMIAPCHLPSRRVRAIIISHAGSLTITTEDSSILTVDEYWMQHM